MHNDYDYALMNDPLMSDDDPTIVLPPPAPVVRRERLIASAVLGALTLIVYGDVLLRFGNTVISDPQGDTSLYFAPFRSFGFREMARGNLVLWNPHVFSGAPFMGGFQSALLYPPNLLYMVLPLGFALNLDICAHTFLLGLFTFLWMRPRMRRIEPALFAAALLMFGGPYALRVLAGQLTMLSSLAYAPLLLYAIDRVFDAIVARKPVLGPVLLGIAATSLQVVAGYPGTVFMTAFTVGCYCLIKLAGSPRRVHALLSLAAIAVAPLGITAMQLWLGAEAASESIRAGGGSYDFATSFSFPIENLITIVAPGFFGDRVPTAYWGRWNFWDVSLFVGVAGTLFTIAGAIWGRGRGGMTAAAIGLLILFVSFGRYTPLFQFLYDYVPGFRSFRAPSKFLFFVLLFIGLSAGLGLDALLVRPSRARALSWIGLGFAVALGVGAWWVVVAHRAGADGQWARLIHSAKNNVEVYMWVEATEAYIAQAARAAVWGLSLAGAAATVAAVLLFFAPARPWMIMAVAVLGVLEILVFSRAVRRTFVLDEDLRLPVRDAYAMCTNGERVIDMCRFDGRVRNFAVEVGGRAVWGYDPVIMKRYGEFACFAAGGIMRGTQLRDEVFTFGSDPFGTSLNRGFNDYTATGLERGGKFFALLRPRFVVRPPVPPEFRALVRYFTNQAGHVDTSGPETSGDTPKESVYEIQVYYPEFFFTNEYVVKPANFETLNELAEKNIGFDKTTLLEERPEPEPQAAPVGKGSVRLVDQSTDHMTLHAELPSNAILVITHSYSRGWRAVGLGASAHTKYRVMPADYTLIGIPLSAGVHDFRLEYSPAGYRYGRWISLASLAAYVVALGFWARRRYRGTATTVDRAAVRP